MHHKFRALFSNEKDPLQWDETMFNDFSSTKEGMGFTGGFKLVPFKFVRQKEKPFTKEDIPRFKIGEWDNCSCQVYRHNGESTVFTDCFKQRKRYVENEQTFLSKIVQMLKWRWENGK